MSKITIDRAVVEQALEACSVTLARCTPRALEALRAALDQPQESPYGECDECGTEYSFDPTDGGSICVACLKERLKRPQVEQEPVAWVGEISEGADLILEKPKLWSAVPLYTHPQPPRQPLAEMEIVNLRQLTSGTLDVQFVKFARVIEAAHGIKEQK